MFCVLAIRSWNSSVKLNIQSLRTNAILPSNPHSVNELVDVYFALSFGLDVCCAGGYMCAIVNIQ